MVWLCKLASRTGAHMVCLRDAFVLQRIALAGRLVQAMGNLRNEN
jgi:hypothetical protein